VDPEIYTDDDDSKTIGQAIKFMEILTRNARADYISRQKHWNKEVPFDDTIIANNTVFIEQYLSVASDSGFDFGERWMSEVFDKLILMQQRILTLTLVDGLTDREAADVLGCDIEFVYRHKYRAIKKFRDRILKGDNRNGKK